MGGFYRYYGLPCNSPMFKVAGVWPEFLQWLAFYFLTVGLLKVGSAYFIHRNPSSAVGNGLGWFVPGIA